MTRSFSLLCMLDCSRREAYISIYQCIYLIWADIYWILYKPILSPPDSPPTVLQRFIASPQIRLLEFLRHQVMDPVQQSKYCLEGRALRSSGCDETLSLKYRLFRRRVTKPFCWLYFLAWQSGPLIRTERPNSRSQQIVRGSFVVPYYLGLFLPFLIWPNQVPHVFSLIPR